MLYDVCLCACPDDERSHGHNIWRLMKQSYYRVWYEDEDLLVGHNELHTTEHAIEHSKRTVCLLTEQFLNRYNFYCAVYTVRQKSRPPKAINNILACAKPFRAKFCPVI